MEVILRWTVGASFQPFELYSNILSDGLIQFIFGEMLMLGNKCSDGMDSHSQRLTPIVLPPFLYNMNQNQGFLAPCDIYPHELPTILKHNFYPLPYPYQQHPNNPFCPLCLKFVPPDAAFRGYFAAIFGKTYLAHQACLQREDSNCLNTILEEVSHAKLAIINSINDARSFCFGEKEYYIEVEVSHPLTSKPFFTLKNKIQTNGSFLVWNFRKFHQPESCFPNIIAFPYPDFEIEISHSKLAERDGRCKQKAFVNLHKLKLQGEKLVKISTDDFDLIVRVIHDERQKMRIIDEMNFKYQHPVDIALPLIEIIKLQLKLPSHDSDEDNQYICSRENSSITELLNENSPETSTIKSSSYYGDERKIAYLSEVVSERSFQKEKVDLNRLISSGKLSEYVKNNVQSRNFQAFLGEVSCEELNDILRTLSPDFCELVTHEYANYMMQRLFTICNTQQRMYILEKLAGSIPMLVKNKQGTHTLQTLIALLTQEDEHCLVVQITRKALYQLSEHSNGTHFVQKIINVFSIRHTLPYFHFASENFVKFALNKNAMCVLKQMMRKLKDIQDAGFKSVDRNEAEDLQRKFINATALNIDRLIQDCYGNYVVQFCYEFFGSERCIRVTEMILERFPQFSIQKYSSSVVLKCVEGYWGNKDIIQKLKYSLNGNSILDMYRNKQGNKILLAIMEKYENTAVREKIYSQLVMAEPAKFQHDRWGVTLGSRSGTVGTIWQSFPEAAKPSPNKKKKHYNIIQ